MRGAGALSTTYWRLGLVAIQHEYARLNDARLCAQVAVIYKAPSPILSFGEDDTKYAPLHTPIIAKNHLFPPSLSHSKP
ncbi:MAG: hypothetical protein KatS3mg056_3668 [Chloroflexus sp.]|nr:MAG: hypothetical protein KatS3mg056_3668 [Chloroflexus sp.]